MIKPLKKNWKKAAAALIAVCLILGGALYSREPALIGNLPASYIEAETVFSDRIQKEFPAGTNEADIIAKLQEQGFKVFADKKLASFSKNKFPCNLNWTITWEASKDKKIAAARGRIGSTCL